MYQDNLVIAYGSNQISLNKNEQYIVISNKEAGFLLGSLLKNLEITEIKTK